MERNANYRGDRPRRIARIVYTDGFKAPDAISRVKDGRADYVTGWAVSYDPRGRSHPAAAGQRVRPGEPGGAIGHRPLSAESCARVRRIAFNTRRPLFRDVRMRRAAAYALDRRALAAVFGDQPSDHLIPTAVRGPGGNIAYTDAPDLAAARKLAGTGPRRNATLYFCGDPANKRIAEIVRANLAEIRIDVHIDEDLRCLTGPKPEHMAAADLQLISLIEPVLDPAPFVEAPLGSRYMAPGYWQNARLRKQIESARALRGAARIAAYAKLEKALVRDAVPVTVFGNYVTPEFFSARIGCRVSQGALNFADLGALCLRD